RFLEGSFLVHVSLEDATGDCPQASGSGIRQIALSNAFLAEGKIACGEVKLATIPGELPIPIGTAGILGLDFLALFDWDFDVRSEKVRIATAPKDRRAPVQFDVDGMVVVPLTKIRTPSRAELYACSVKVAVPGDDVQEPLRRKLHDLRDMFRLFQYGFEMDLQTKLEFPTFAGVSLLDSGMINRLAEFPTSMRALERKLLDLEMSIRDLNEELKEAGVDEGKASLKGGSQFGAVGGAAIRGDPVFDQAPAPPFSSPAVDEKPLSEEAEVAAPTTVLRGSAAAPSTTVIAGAATNYQRWRKDQKCGKAVGPLPDGKPVECEPTGEFACCSVNGWCGNSKKHCSCKGCVNYRDIYAGQSQGTSQKAVALPPSPPKDGHQGKTVVVIIPFRDRENHLKLFKPFWRWFAESGRSPKTVQRWVVVVAEQFDVACLHHLHQVSIAVQVQTFNRGWNFNAGLAVVSAQSTASPDIRPDMGLDFDCAVIQDIDYLPEKGVDYAECDVPTQLSAEIDRYKWKTPYLTSAGGIVGMSLKHWRKINGFGNNYFGWGGEDDELHHRLRLGGLLYGD
ncbi:bre-4, partial [Symbiodinium necroappetens]